MAELDSYISALLPCCVLIAFKVHVCWVLAEVGCWLPCSGPS